MSLDQKLVEILLKPDKMYYHCASHGVIYLDKAMQIPLIDLQETTGSAAIPRELNDYKITSGYCKPCLDKALYDIELAQKGAGV